MSQNEENQKEIKQSHYVTVTDMGHLIEVQHMEKKNTVCHVKNIDADRYMLIETGEILEKKKSLNRSENENSLRKTFKKMRYLINNNFKGNANELFVTLTFAKESFDSKMVYKDIDKFLKRLKYRYKDVSSIDYINVVEPHASGQWHAHMLLRFNDVSRIFIPILELKEIWSHGRIDIQTLKDVDNIGAYLSAYLADHEVPDDYEPPNENVEVMVKNVGGKDKKFIKGGRLKYYPPGMRLYRKSKGILYPERTEMTYKKAKKIVGSVKPHFRKTYDIEKDDFTNTITYEQYNLKRQ